MESVPTYKEVLLRMPLSCDLTRLYAYVKRMGGMAIAIPEIQVDNENVASVDEIFGVWDDKNYPTAEEMCAFLKESRTLAKDRDSKLDEAWL